jgi:hypothetical protein
MLFISVAVHDPLGPSMGPTTRTARRVVKETPAGEAASDLGIMALALDASGWRGGVPGGCGAIAKAEEMVTAEKSRAKEKEANQRSNFMFELNL